MVEIHPDPEKALSDGRQSLDFKQFESMREKLNTLMHTQA
jgi:3-deoxy-D-arabino-heptulosonate 7-phosphate (DAHP) synthase